MADVALKTNQDQSKRQGLELLRSQLKNERSSFDPQWRELSEYILPRRSRFLVTDRNRGERRNQKIINSTATLAARTLRSGMMGGITSPARPWFRLTTPDPGMSEFAPVKDWLSTVTTRMQTAFLRSNLYNALPIVYGDMGVFGSSCMFVEEDFDDVIRCYPFQVGSYMLATNSRLKVDVFMREFSMTVRQLIQMFGVRKESNGEPDWSKFSLQIKTLWDSGQTETWIDVVHAILPNQEYRNDRLQSNFKRYKSCYYESGNMGGGTTTNYLTREDDGRFLRESGYDIFPVLAPRWEVGGEDVYGTDCPGMTSIGDIKALQKMERRGAQGLDKVVNPAMVGPSSLRTSAATLIAGGITYLDERDGQKGFRPAHEVRLELDKLLMAENRHEYRIQRAFYEDLFLMLANEDRSGVTAREVDEKHEEKLLALGPVLEQLNQDGLDPLIDLTFEVLNRQGAIPPPPKELEGQKLKVEYISIMAQAQKLAGISGLERFATFTANLVNITKDPTILDKVDTDELVDVYGDLTSIPPGIVRPDDEVEEIRAGRQKAQQAQAQAEMAANAAGAAKDLSETDMSGDNALTRLTAQAKAGQVVPQ